MRTTTPHLPRADRHAKRAAAEPTLAGVRRAAAAELEALGAPPRPWATIHPTGGRLLRWRVTYGTGRFTASEGSRHLTRRAATRAVERFLERAHKLEHLGVSLARPEAGR